ncbi:HNH endonuclease [Rhizobium ecuadorense]|uniref:HNH endonuclease n=1 Tax=Rhizobium ecuadorense TaxID=1671795 RepID=UPI000673823C|nr:HNH endonuclease [Rhizobium ecuadorense]
MSPAEFRALALKAKKDAEEYRLTALTAPEPRKTVLLKWAKNREEDSAFYTSRISVLHTCKVEDCSKDVFRAGYCSAHYNRLKKHGTPLGGGSSPRDGERFIQNVIASETEDCIDWPYAKAGAGYGVIEFGEGIRFYVHRFVCEVAHGEAPSKSHQAAHSCGRGGCINPRHLRWATPSENNLDKIQHGTIGRGEKGAMAKLSEKQVVEIRKLRSDGLTEQEVSRLFNVDRAQIGRITRRENWSHV